MICPAAPNWRAICYADEAMQAQLVYEIALWALVDAEGSAGVVGIVADTDGKLVAATEFDRFVGYVAPLDSNKTLEGKPCANAVQEQPGDPSPQEPLPHIATSPKGSIHQ